MSNTKDTKHIRGSKVKYDQGTIVTTEKGRRAQVQADGRWRWLPSHTNKSNIDEPKPKKRKITANITKPANNEPKPTPAPNVKVRKRQTVDASPKDTPRKPNEQQNPIKPIKKSSWYSFLPSFLSDN